MDMYQKRKERQNNKEEISTNKTSINWYSGHMAKTKRLISENLNLIDIIYEVIDGRIPYSSKIKDIDNLLKNKPRIMIITKYDLCDKKETDKFIKYYENFGYYILKYDLTNNTNFNDLFDLSNLILREKIEKQKAKGITKETIRALVVGIPNAGKSTLINKIVGKKATVTGNKPGITKNLSWIRVKDNIELLDTPGILWPKLDQEKVAYNLAATTAIKEEILEKEDIAIYILTFLYKYYPQILEQEYGLFEIDDIEEAYNFIARKKGFLRKGGLTDYDKVTDLIINDVKNGKIKGVTFDRSDQIDQKRNY